MDSAAIIAIATAIAQLGVATASYRLGTRLDKRQNNHEKEDREFQEEVRARLGIK